MRLESDGVLLEDYGPLRLVHELRRILHQMLLLDKMVHKYMR